MFAWLTLWFDRNLFYLVHIKGALTHGFYRKSYAQFGEDLFLVNYFKNKKEGFFVDVGAFHPKHYSNTYTLYRRGWSGINVEPNAASCALFRWVRPRDVTVNMGVAAAEGTQTYYVFNHQSCNTFSETQKDEMLKRKFLHLIDTREIACAPLRDIVRQHAGGKRIDLLNIDVEGMGFEVLQTLDMSTNAPEVICIEDDTFSEEKRESSAVYALLTARGYMLRSFVGPTCIYAYEKHE